MVKNIVTLVPGLLLAVLLWFIAGFTICGISGCSGGGFGVAYDPNSTRLLLVASGVAASLAPAVKASLERSKKWAVIAAILFISVPLMGGFLIGAGLDGLPRN